MAPRARRTTDGFTFAISLAVLAALATFAEPPFGFARLLDEFLGGLPNFLDGLWQLVVDAFLLVALAIVVTALVQRRWRLVRDQALAVVAATVIWLIAARVVAGEWPEVWGNIRSAEPPPLFVSPRVALPAALALTSLPHLALPWRKIVRFLIPASAFAVVALVASSSVGAVAGIAVAGMAASMVHLAFGSSAGRPSLDLVTSALASFGITPDRLEAGERQQAGVFVVEGDAADGGRLHIKVYGRDAYDTQLLATVWRTLWYRDPGTSLRFRRSEQVEHEAFMTLLAAQAGVVTDRVVIAGVADTGDALLVLRRHTVPLTAEAMAGPVPVAELWDLVDRLHDAGVVHGQLDADHLAVDENGRLGIIGFAGASISADPDLHLTDQAQILATSAILVGSPEKAAAAAAATIGAERLKAVLPYLQRAALGAQHRRAMKEGLLNLDELRNAAAEAAGVDVPKLVTLRRVTVGSVVKVVLPVVAVVALLSQLSGLDWDLLIEEVRQATVWLLVLGFLLAQLGRVPAAVSTLGASPIALPFGPVYGLQLAISYINLAIPSSAARVAVSVRFFQRRGLEPGSALAIGALDGLSGFIVQAFLLTSMLLFTPASLNLDLDPSAAGGLGRLLVGVLAVAIICLIAVMALGKWRKAVIGFVRRILLEARSALKGLRSPRRLGQLFGGNLAAELVFASTLGTFALALGYSVSLPQLLVINMSVALLAGLLPVPGGIGVTEGGLAYGLTMAGLPPEAAFAVALLHRIATFYLPPIWGYFAFRWLERNEYV